jgi:hypothetical protein
MMERAREIIGRIGIREIGHTCPKYTKMIVSHSTNEYLSN